MKARETSHHSFFSRGGIKLGNSIKLGNHSMVLVSNRAIISKSESDDDESNPRLREDL